MSRFLSIWLPYLITDRAIQLRPELKDAVFVLALPERGRMLVKAASPAAVSKGIRTGMVVADARAVMPGLKVYNYKENVEERLLCELAEWAIRFTPVAAIDLPDGLLLDISGCAHLWGGEAPYLNDILKRLSEKGFVAKAAIADTVGVAWAVARFEKRESIIASGNLKKALSNVAPAGLRLEQTMLDRMHKLGFYTIGSFIDMPRTVLRRRFGQFTLKRISQALGEVPEPLLSVQPSTVFQARLPCLEPLRTRTAIDIALKTVLEQLSLQLLKEVKGLRKAEFKSYRLDGIVQQIEIGTNRPVRNVAHLLKLFEQKIGTIKPGLGIELFTLDAPVVEDLSSQQESLWTAIGSGKENTELSNLLDRIAGKIGAQHIHRYLPAEHYWPERSYKMADSVFEIPDTDWSVKRARPILLLKQPEKIEVSVPIPDYPPMLFIYKGKIHKIKKADGPERISREWWRDKKTQIRDYYRVEDESGARYWVFRSGIYQDGKPEWFLHGYFA